MVLPRQWLRCCRQGNGFDPSVDTALEANHNYKMASSIWGRGYSPVSGLVTESLDLAPIRFNRSGTNDYGETNRSSGL